MKTATIKRFVKGLLKISNNQAQEFLKDYLEIEDNYVLYSVLHGPFLIQVNSNWWHRPPEQNLKLWVMDPKHNLKGNLKGKMIPVSLLPNSKILDEYLDKYSHEFTKNVKIACRTKKEQDESYNQKITQEKKDKIKKAEKIVLDYFKGEMK